MKSVEQWFDEYEVSHQTPFNKTIHYICVPLIFISTVGLFSSIPVGDLSSIFPLSIVSYVHFGTLLIFLSLVFYSTLSIPIFVGMYVFSMLTLYINHLMAAYINFPFWALSLIIFVIAWIFQFIGHKHEGKKPSLFKDIQFLLIGPAWILNKLYTFFKK
ncbi:Uncharacterized membrane protein YGL010W [Tenacibaculum sp. MAR_2009_124]|uniref:Mpo1 family 2-hydroxy fatty acid dioxygenase n=1 Tax=Tenacibaculum sp. MAR_2009_124 TaxID=1250059 RepID=UPI00089A19E8|nr:Mpo1-like protein [Tenacibaculum sp. MAR_2009_124]SEB45674.1 Uncharacterized membrane protein YGL010W [Tenacibaculum sp. MAR_2009_124]